MKRLYQLPLDTLIYIKLISVGLLILRVAIGLMLMYHGWGKIMNFSNMAPHFTVIGFLPPELNLGLTIFAEFVCAGLVLLGLMTRLACIPVIIMFLVAIVTVHWHDPLFIPMTAKTAEETHAKEMAILYMVPFLVLFFTGPGIYSIEGIFAKRDSILLDEPEPATEVETTAV